MNRRLLTNPDALKVRIDEVLNRKWGCESLYENSPCDRVKSSSVMLLLGPQSCENGAAPEICFILNKRSMSVPQGGDLCCPGGTAKRTVDPLIARLLTLPGSPLTRWKHWKRLQRCLPGEARLVSRLLATGLRESWEEMRLNPFRVEFLGPMPSQCLLLFRRIIHPMVAWISGQKRFTPSWEVERIVMLPVRELFRLENYARYRLEVPPSLEWRFNGRPDDFPCFRFAHGERLELLWGVTYRIVTLLLEMVFDFTVPQAASLPVVTGVIDESYVLDPNCNGGCNQGAAWGR
ncbi:MAG: hypothetical protein GX443_10555 [Deltaproteobacteria bacterium]|nr:hypothetical protein [Deltaproteobacteria bacterium]